MRIIYILFIMVILVFTSCNKGIIENQDDNVSYEEATFTLSIDDNDSMTKSTTPALRYVMELWNEEGTEAVNGFADGTHRAENNDAKFTVTLEKDKKYTFLFWADESNMDDNSKYDVSDLTAVKFIPTGSSVMIDEHVYFANTIKTITDVNIPIGLKHAVAKVYLKEERYNMPYNNIEIEYTGYTSFNVLTKGINGSDNKTFKHNFSKNNFTEGEENDILGFFYTFASEDVATRINFIVSEVNTTNAFNIGNVPLNASIATNLLGHFFDPPVGYAIGDVYPKSTAGKYIPPIGVVVAIGSETASGSGRSNSGKIISLKQSNYALDWGADSRATGAVSPDYGEANQNTLRDYISANDGIGAAEYPSYDFCEGKNIQDTENVDESGWYLPAVNELVSISTNAVALNKTLTKIGAAADLLGTSYWSSTEHETTPVTKHYSVVNGVKGESLKTEAKYARCIKKFSSNYGTNDDGYAIGEDYPNTSNKIGVVSAIGPVIPGTSNRSNSGKILSLEIGQKQWALDESDYNEILRVNDSRRSRVDGETNHIAIGLNLSSSSIDTEKLPAYNYCKVKGAGWYLPAISEIEKMEENKAVLQTALEGQATKLVGVQLWSSTEVDGNLAFTCMINDIIIPTIESNLGKASPNPYVRCMRKF